MNAATTLPVPPATKSSGAKHRSRRGKYLGERRPLLISYAAYAAAVIALYPLYQHRINPDATAYFSLASKWVHGDWFGAVSGHWSPLFVWLIALGLKAGMNATAAATAVNAIASCALLWGANCLVNRAAINTTQRLLLLGSLGACATFFTFAEITPDLLLTSLLTCYLAVASSRASQRGTFILGGVAGLAYLAKPIGLLFILVHLPLASLLDSWRDRHAWRSEVRRVSVALAMMLAIAAPWAACVSIKYHRLTIGTGGGFLYRAMAPPFRDAGIVNAGLGALPNATAPNYWEDPDQLNLPPWSPWDSAGRSVRWVGDNLMELMLWTLVVSVAALPVFCYGWMRWLGGKREREVLFLLSGIVVSSAAYCLVLVADRYLWPVGIWLLILSVRLVPNGRRAVATTGLLCLSFLPRPVFGLLAQKHQGDGEYRIGQTLKSELGLRGKVASLSAWHSSLYVCYAAALPYYGVTAPGSREDVTRELSRYGIQYLFVWPDSKPPSHLLDDFRRVESGSIPPKLKLYAVPSAR